MDSSGAHERRDHSGKQYKTALNKKYGNGGQKNADTESEPMITVITLTITPNMNYLLFSLFQGLQTDVHGPFVLLGKHNFVTCHLRTAGGFKHL